MSKKLGVLQTRLLRNIVDHPALPAVLELMQPKTLVRLIDRIGLNDAAELMALVPARNLLRALDQATWKSPVPGASPVFDPAESVYDNETRRFVNGVENVDTGQHPIENAMATDPANDEVLLTRNVLSGTAIPLPSQDQVTALSRLLENEAIVEPKRFESLSWKEHEPRRAVLTDMLNRMESENQEAFQKRTRELAYLATVLMAGSALEGQPFTGGNARDAALATCNLGAEFIQSRKIALKLDTEPGLIRHFLIGWQLLGTLRNRVIDAVKTSLADLETSPRLRNSPWLRNEAQIGFRDLQNAVEKHHFTDASDAVTFLSIVFDATACRAITPLLDHLPHLATIVQNESDKNQPRWIESIADLDLVSSLLSRLTNE